MMATTYTTSAATDTATVPPHSKSSSDHQVPETLRCRSDPQRETRVGERQGDCGAGWHGCFGRGEESDAWLAPTPSLSIRRPVSSPACFTCPQTRCTPTAPGWLDTRLVCGNQ